jgi:hypothetical protein
MDRYFGDITMTRTPVMRAAIAAVVFGVPGLAWADKVEKHVRRVTHRAVAPADWSAAPGGGPRFVRVGPNGYWVTTTWGCYIDEGQGRIRDCEMGGSAP